MKTKQFVFLLLVCVALSNCGIQKRHYRSGYFISAKAHHLTQSKKNLKSLELVKNTNKTGFCEKYLSKNRQISQPDSDSLVSDKTEQKSSGIKTSSFFSSTSREGRTRNSEQHENTLQAQVQTNAYPGNVSKYTFFPKIRKVDIPADPKKRYTNEFASLSVLFGTIAALSFLISLLAEMSFFSFVLFFSALAGLITGIVGMVQISNNKTEYKGMEFAILGIILSLLGLIGTVVLVVMLGAG
jgi:hypothetical protein